MEVGACVEECGSVSDRWKDKARRKGIVVFLFILLSLSLASIEQ